MLAFAPVSVSEFKTNELIPLARSRYPPPEHSDGEGSRIPPVSGRRAGEKLGGRAIAINRLGKTEVTDQLVDVLNVLQRDSPSKVLIPHYFAKGLHLF